jgi:hypothetical protein
MAVYANLTIDQGSSYYSTIDLEGSNGLPYDLTGHTARGQIRRTYSSLTSYPFTVTIPDAQQGNIAIELGHTATIQMKAGRYVYDIEIIDSTTGDITRVVEGQVEITPGVTR